MGCSHRKQRTVIEWTVQRPQKPPQVITEDTYVLKVCDSCKGIAIDTRNIYCMSRGRFQGQVKP